MRKSGQKLVLFNSGARFATLAYFNGQLFMRCGDKLHFLKTGQHYIIPEGNGLAINVAEDRIRFTVRKAGAITFDTDQFSGHDRSNWTRIQGQKEASVAAGRSSTGTRVALALGLAAAAAGAAVAFEGCPAEAEDQYEASGE